MSVEASLRDEVFINREVRVKGVVIFERNAVFEPVKLEITELGRQWNDEKLINSSEIRKQRLRRLGIGLSSMCQDGTRKGKKNRCSHCNLEKVEEA